MKRKLMLLLACLFVGIGLVTAQTQKVTGVVISEEDGQPVIGASVLVKGTQIGIVTDIDGKFELTNVPSSAKTLQVSYIGMETQEAEIKPSMCIVLKANTEVLDEVMVVAYGTAKKSSFTGSASVVSGEKIAKMQTSNVSKSLEGAMAGVQISQSSGQPGSSANIYVRGIGSISAGKEALIVVDGVPYEGNLNQIAPSDIESMTVLKDAAANSLYGARGANGVVLITTKKGKSGKVKVTFENRTGVNTRGIPSYDILTSPAEYYELYWEAIRNNAHFNQGMSYAQAGIFASQNLIKELGGYNNYNVSDTELINPVTGRLNSSARLLYHDDWLEEAFRPGMRQENVVSLSGGTDKTTYYASLGYLYDNSYTVNSDMNRINARVKIDQEVNKWFKAGFNLAYSNVKTNSPNVGGTNFSSIFFFGQTIAPIYPVYMYDSEGNRIYDSQGNVRYDYGTEMGKRPQGSNVHPIDQQLNDIYRGSTDVVNAKAYAEFSFLKDFKLTVNASIDNFNSRSVSFQTPIGGDALNVNGRGTTKMSRYFVINANQLLNWSHTYNQLHNVEVLLGHETKQDRSESLWAQKENFFVPDNPELDNAAKLSDASSSAAEYALEGYFGQVKYNFDEKYYVSGSFRRDASSRFHPDNRWGSFWSVGASWRMNKEAFMESLTWINDLKVKASFGTQGNDAIGNNQPYKDQYIVVSNDGAIGTQYVFRGNKDITWEKSNNFNAGVEFKLWDRLSGNIEYFSKTTWDLLYYKPLPPSQGVPSGIYENTMRMRNQGVEIELNYDIFTHNNFKWNVALNATHYKNKLLELPADRPQDGWATGNYFRKVGKPLYNYYDYKYAGVDPENGDALYWADETDEKGNVIEQKTVNKTELATRYELGKSPIPDLYGGFSTTIETYGFDLNANFAYQIGGWVYDSLYQGFMGAGSAGKNWHKDIFNRWTPENRYTDVPRLQTNDLNQGCSGDRALTKASYLSLRNLTLGYSLPKNWLQKVHIEKLRLYIVGDNLFLLSARRGFDPRQSILDGQTGYNYSAMRTVSFGINLEF